MCLALPAYPVESSCVEVVETVEENSELVAESEYK